MTNGDFIRSMTDGDITENFTRGICELIKHRDPDCRAGQNRSAG